MGLALLYSARLWCRWLRCFKPFPVHNRCSLGHSNGQNFYFFRSSIPDPRGTIVSLGPPVRLSKNKILAPPNTVLTPFHSWSPSGGFQRSALRPIFASALRAPAFFGSALRAPALSSAPRSSHFSHQRSALQRPPPLRAPEFLTKIAAPTELLINKCLDVW